MAVNYNELFNFLYSTRIPESLKDEVLNTVELPIQESIELPSYMYECVNFLDTLAYSNMSEELVNELIDNVFEGCSEEFMEEVLEAYTRVKAYEYIVEGAAPVGLTGIAKENKAREEAAKRAEARREAVGKAVDTFKSKAAEVGNKAKEGIKAAVGKVKDWYKKATQDRPIGLAKINNFKAQNKPVEAPKKEVKSVEAPKVEPKKEEPKVEVKPKTDDSSKQLNFLTKTGKIAKKFQAKEPETTRKIDTVKAEAPKVEPKKEELKIETKPIEQPASEPKKEESKAKTSKLSSKKSAEKVADEISKEPPKKLTGGQKLLIQTRNQMLKNAKSQEEIDKINKFSDDIMKSFSDPEKLKAQYEAMKRNKRVRTKV